MTVIHYVLDDEHNVVACPDGRDGLMQWAEFMEHNPNARRVARTVLPNGKLVSTVFIGMGMGFAKSPPLLFETMIFPSATEMSESDWSYCERYSTWAEAQAGHKRAVEMAEKDSMTTTPTPADEVERLIAEFFPEDITPEQAAKRDMRGIFDHHGPALKDALLDALRNRPAASEGQEWKPITMQDIRLAAGEGKLSAADMLAACNTVLRRRATVITTEDRVWAHNLAQNLPTLSNLQGETED